MGFDCGFDIYPRLEVTSENKETYKRFLDELIHTYRTAYDERGRREDGKVLEMSTDPGADKAYIVFMVGEGPKMPSNPDRCNYFLRFSSKVSGGLTRPAEKYINAVHKIALKYFGDRVQYWHEICETGDERQWGYYDWTQIYDANRELEALEKGQG